ncbi:excisionase [Bordetella avium]|nr:excisionase [Bordetella avium]RIQ71614.1 excisionase [Bordetella avium]
MAVRWLTIERFVAESGYTAAAVRSKIRDEIWAKGEVWKHAPDGRVLINTEGYEKWVETGEALKPYRKAALKSASYTKGQGAVSACRSSPPPLT